MKKFIRQFKGSMFGATATTIASVLLIFELLAFLSIAYYLMVPVARRSADDLAAFMVVSAHTWVSVAPDARGTFEYNLERLSGIRIETPIKAVPQTTIIFPYIYLLKNALSVRTKSTVTAFSSRIGGQLWYWLDTTMYGKKIRFGITDLRLGISPPIALALIIFFVISSTFLSTMIFVRRVTQPLSKLVLATSQLEKGKMPSELPEYGITEIATLGRSFNKMAREVSSLLTNRTTLLTGIAHDLRTPLARIRLSLALFESNKNPELLIREIEIDIENMSCLIDESLTFGAGIVGKEKKIVIINDLIEELIYDCFNHDSLITLASTKPLKANINVLAIRRILINLLNNAVRYGNNQPIRVTCVRDEENINISILDHGIGIPVSKMERVFEPFYRVDEARSLDANGSSGLGLAIVKQLVDTNNWKIYLNATIGGGLTAILVIPIHDVDKLIYKTNKISQ